jgi:hypothetical protein
MPAYKSKHNRKKKDVFSLRTAIEAKRYRKAQQERAAEGKESVSFEEFQRRARKQKSITGTAAERKAREKITKGIGTAKRVVKQIKDWREVVLDRRRR